MLSIVFEPPLEIGMMWSRVAACVRPFNRGMSCQRRSHIGQASYRASVLPTLPSKTALLNSSNEPGDAVRKRSYYSPCRPRSRCLSSFL